MEQTTYDDELGAGYAGRRRPDPRIEKAIVSALADARCVINVGAGTGSYEPTDRSVLAVEPSSVMIRQRSAGAAPCVRASAESLPVADGAFDAALAVLTIHHRRPEIYLDPVALRSMSSFAKIDADRGLSKLASDLDTGVWRERNAAILDLDALDLGYRLLVWELHR